MSDTITHSDQMIEGLLLTLRELIPSASIQCQTAPSSTRPKKKGFLKRGTAGNAELHFHDGVVDVWFDLSHGNVCVLHISRKNVPLTRHEAEVLGRLPDALSGVLVHPGPRALELSQRIAARLSISTILVSRYLRGGTATTYWTAALILSALQQLTFRRYEGHRCTTGFVYSAKPDLYMGTLPLEDYTFVPFKAPIGMNTTKLASPATFRYVDGRNSFYFIDNWQKIHGFFVARNPKSFGLVDRSSLLHILPLVSHQPGRVWAAFIGNNDDVRVVTAAGVFLQWDQNHWHLRDTSILESILLKHGCSREPAQQISSVCFALSDLRRGTVLLIPDDAANVPKPVGAIDNSDLGAALKLAFLNQSLADLCSSNSIVGVLTSDGLTTVAKDGRVLACGEIVDISGAARSKPTGGGRTHAAVAASAYGLAIKVSEDGPISVFCRGEQLIRM